jgi:hypothetical protein
MVIDCPPPPPRAARCKCGDCRGCRKRDADRRYRMRRAGMGAAAPLRVRGRGSATAKARHVGSVAASGPVLSAARLHSRGGLRSHGAPTQVGAYDMPLPQVTGSLAVFLASRATSDAPPHSVTVRTTLCCFCPAFWNRATDVSHFVTAGGRRTLRRSQRGRPPSGHPPSPQLAGRGSLAGAAWGPRPPGWSSSGLRPWQQTRPPCANESTLVGRPRAPAAAGWRRRLPPRPPRHEPVPR